MSWSSQLAAGYSEGRRRWRNRAGGEGSGRTRVDGLAKGTAKKPRAPKPEQVLVSLNMNSHGAFLLLEPGLRSPPGRATALHLRPPRRHLILLRARLILACPSQRPAVLQLQPAELEHAGVGPDRSGFRVGVCVQSWVGQAQRADGPGVQGDDSAYCSGERWPSCRRRKGTPSADAARCSTPSSLRTPNRLS